MFVQLSILFDHMHIQILPSFFFLRFSRRRRPDQRKRASGLKRQRNILQNGPAVKAFAKRFNLYPAHGQPRWRAKDERGGAPDARPATRPVRKYAEACHA